MGRRQPVILGYTKSNTKHIRKMYYMYVVFSTYNRVFHKQWFGFVQEKVRSKKTKNNVEQQERQQRQQEHHKYQQ